MLISGTYSYLATTANGGNVTNSNGYDIIFASDAAGNNMLPFERENYNATTGAVVFWVQVPTVSHTTDTVIYMFYGNSAVTTDQSNPAGVWDSNYTGVWHLPNGTTLSANDSTSSANNGTNNGATATTGIIDGGASFNGTSAYLSVPATISNQSAFTIEGWFSTHSTAKQYLYSESASSNTFIYVSVNENVTGDMEFGVENSGTWGGCSTGNINLNNGNWHHFVAVQAQANSRILYVDGNLICSDSTSVAAVSATSANIGRRVWTDNTWVNGTMDEVRTSIIARGSDWVTAEYNNESSPATFYSISATNVSAITYIQSAGSYSSSSVTSLSQSFSNNTTAGNAIIVAVGCGAGLTTSSVTDTQGNTYTQAVASGPMSVWYATNIKGGTDVVTASFSGSSGFSTIYIHEYTGVAASSALDVYSSATGSSTSVSSGSATTTQANELIFGFAGVGEYVNAAGSGFTLRQTAGGNGSEDEIVSSIGSYAATFTQATGSGCCSYQAVMATFKAVSGGGGGGNVANPSISPSSGTYSSPQTITVDDSTSGATICVRTDGGTPTANTPGTCDSPATAYTPGAQFPVTIPSGGATVSALGTLAGDTNSGVATSSYSLASAAAAPAFSPAAGTYSGSQTVTISTTSSGAVICWNTTGSPATNGASGCMAGTLYSGPVTVSASETLYAVAGGTGYSDSSPSSASYTIGPTGPQVYYYIQDSLGTTRMMTDSSGNVCYDADFYPFGGERAYVDSCPQNHKFTGKERDSESSLDNFGARYNSSQLGRFMSPDPSSAMVLKAINPQRWNGYAYAINSPLSYTDPTGKDAAAVNFESMVGGQGHEALLIVDQDGTTTFASFGPTSHGLSNWGGANGAGLVSTYSSSSGTLPPVQFGSNGLPTQQSYEDLTNALAKIEGVSPYAVRLNYFKTSETDTESLKTWVSQMKQSAAAGAGPFCWYNVGFNNCADFTVAGLFKGGALSEQQVNSLLMGFRPNSLFNELLPYENDEFDLLDVILKQHWCVSSPGAGSVCGYD